MSTVSCTVVLAMVLGLPALRAEAEPGHLARGRSGRARIVTPPVLERAAYRFAIIRWTANTAGGTEKHYGVVRYGTDPKKLDKTARSPIKWSKATWPNVTYRVLVDGLIPHQTYYYTVDVEQFDGRSMQLNTRVSTFTTQPRS